MSCMCIHSSTSSLVVLVLSAVQSESAAVRVKIHVSCVYAARATRRSARSGRRSSSAGRCVCARQLKCRSFIHCRLSRRAAGVAMQCSAVGAVRVWPCPRHAISRYRQLRRSAMTLMTSATTAAVASLDRASPRVYACIYVYINTVQYSD